MLEDSLKRARQSYFLILTISVTIILFSLSIRKPDKIVFKKENIENILKLDIASYDLFVDEKIKDIQYHDISNFLNEIDTLNLNITGIDKIISKLKYLDYSGRLYIKNTVLNDLSMSSLNSLNDIQQLETNKNVQWFRPELKALEKKIINFFLMNNIKNVEIENINTTGSRNKFDPSTYPSIKDIDLTLSFRIDSTNVTFRSPILGSIEEIPNTSLKSWLDKRQFDSAIIKTVGDSIVWLNGEKKFDINESQKNLKVLLSLLNEDLDKYSAKKQSINFLGIEVSGSFIFIVSPILMFILIYFLFCNLLHLENLVNSNSRDLIKKFAWTALNGNVILKYIDIIIIVLIFPLVSLSILLHNLRLSIFDNVYLTTITSFFILIIALCFVLCFFILLKFKFLHNKLKSII